MIVAGTVLTRCSASAVRSEDGSFQSAGHLMLPPGTHYARLRVYDEGNPVTNHLLEGPNDAVLRFQFGNAVNNRIAVTRGVPTPIPLDTVRTPAQQSGTHSKTSVPPPPGIRLQVDDTTDTTGSLRLVLERYGDVVRNEEQEPLRVDFDVTIPVRTIPSADTTSDS